MNLMSASDSQMPTLSTIYLPQPCERLTSDTRPATFQGGSVSKKARAKQLPLPSCHGYPDSPIGCYQGPHPLPLRILRRPTRRDCYKGPHRERIIDFASHSDKILQVYD